MAAKITRQHASQNQPGPGKRLVSQWRFGGGRLLPERFGGFLGRIQEGFFLRERPGLQVRGQRHDERNEHDPRRHSA